MLGPFEVRLDGGEPVSLGGRRQRALLAVLVLHANEVVSTDRLVDQLWGEHPPATALHTIQVFVSRLRGALAAASDRLVTAPPGYKLEIGFDELDADRYERLHARARTALVANDAAHAAALLRDAEALWRGPPLAEFTYEPFAQATIARLEELRVSLREDLIEAELALGWHTKVVSDLEALVREQPFRERPRGQLMLALYRCGRQAEALDAFQQARRTLVQELAVEPGIALRELEQAILRQDPALLVASPTPAADKRSQPEMLPDADAKPALRERPAPVKDVAERPAKGVADTAGQLLRKTTTVLVGRLAATRGADPETARRLCALGWTLAEQIATAHGGTFLPGLGGEVVGVFGLPLTREDDALRALRAAEELRAGVAAVSAAESDELVIHMGIDTGQVVAQAPGDLFGAPLTSAITFARAAQAGEVLLGDATCQLARDAIRVAPALDGTAWRLVELITETTGIRRRMASQMVDRDSELAAVRAALARAELAGSAHLLTVVGDPGIGKTRLAQELVDDLGDQATVLAGHCLSYGDGTAFWPLREAFTQAAGGESRDALHALIGDAQDADLVASVIAATLGLAPAQSVEEQVPWAFRRLLEILATRNPLLLVIEDAQWIDTPLQELVDYLVDWLRAPVLLLCLARPELLDEQPRWGGGPPRVSSLLLGPLSEQDTLRLLNDNLGERQASAAEAARILRTAEGNPLFVEQLLAGSEADRLWGPDREIPTTIENVLAARLDRLGSGERAFIARAAIIGREFYPSAVLELLPAEDRPASNQDMRALVRHGLIEPNASTMAGEETLRFHHLLIRDVAYGSTPKTLRAELHERFADWLAQRGEGFDEFIGHHLEQAFRYRAELGRIDDEAQALAARAAESLTAAGRRALGRWDTRGATKLLRRSAELFAASGHQRPDVLLDLGSALSETGEFGDAERVLGLALEQARALRAESISARALIELSYRRALVEPSARVRDMLEVAEQATAVFERLGDEDGLSRAYLHVAKAHWIHCHCAEMERALERALMHSDRAGDEHGRSRILTDLARATVIGPRAVHDGIRRCADILARAGDDVVLTAVTDTMLGVLQAMVGEFDEARARWKRTKRQLQAAGLSVTVAALQMYCAFVESMAGTPERAEPELVDAYGALERIGERDRLATIAALLAGVLYAQGRYDEAGRYSQIGEQAASKDDVVSHVICGGARAKVLARAGESRRAEELVNSGVAAACETDFVMLQADALRDRGEVMAILARPQAAARNLQDAIALYEQKGMRVSADRARSSLR